MSNINRIELYTMYVDASTSGYGEIRWFESDECVGD